MCEKDNELLIWQEMKWGDQGECAALLPLSATRGQRGIMQEGDSGGDFSVCRFKLDLWFRNESLQDYSCLLYLIISLSLLS